MKIDIVGGSIGGLSTAISIKKHNNKIKVIVHEKNTKIGYNHEGRKCGEAHTVEKQWKKWIPEKNSYFNIITTGEVIIGDNKRIYHRKPGVGYILNRPEFICQLSRKAEKLGVILKTNDRIKDISELDGDYIIDASGCPSTVKRKLGFTRGIKGVAYQQTLEDSNCFIKDTLKVFYIGEGGYYWIFPRNPDKKEVNIGIGFIKKLNYNLKPLLEQFKEEHKIEGKVNYTTGGLIPMGLQRPLRYKNILFVGDAGVGCFPFNGSGIYRALISGEIAGKCIAEKHPNKYPHIINKEFLKWDVIGKASLYFGNTFNKINKNLALSCFNKLLNHSATLSH